MYYSVNNATGRIKDSNDTMETPRTAPSSTRDYTKIHPRVGDGQAANHQDLRRRSSSCDGVANASPCQQPISFKEYEGVSGNDGSTRSAGIHPTQEKDISVCPRTHGVFYQRQRSKSFSDGSLRQEKWNHWWHLTELVTIHSEEGFSSTDFNHTLRNSIGAPEENEHLRREEQEKVEICMKDLYMRFSMLLALYGFNSRHYTIHRFSFFLA